MEKSGYLISGLMQDYTKKGLPYYASLNTFLSIPQKERDKSSVKELIWKLRPLFETKLQNYKRKAKEIGEIIRSRVQERKIKDLENKTDIQN